MGGDQLIQKAERVRHSHLSYGSQRVALPHMVSRGGLFAAAIQCHDGGVLEG